MFQVVLSNSGKRNNILAAEKTDFDIRINKKRERVLKESLFKSPWSMLHGDLKI